MSAEFRVITFNMRKGKGIRRSQPELEEIVRELARRKPDLLLCQEVFHEHRGLSQSHRLAHGMELLHRYEPNAEYKRGHHGNATFSRFPISRHGNLDISTNPIERRGVLWTRVHLKAGHDMHVFNTHFGLSERQRLIQARRVGSYVQEQAEWEDPVILAGDFNDWTGRADSVIESAGHLSNGMLRLSMRDRTTWSTVRPLFALDRIYFRNLVLLNIEVLRGAPWSRLSDHFPVQATFRLSSHLG
jgi:endonuclease/exonuclease/phosphatase family metal-dependent hydrolase